MIKVRGNHGPRSILWNVYGIARRTYIQLQIQLPSRDPAALPGCTSCGLCFELYPKAAKTRNTIHTKRQTSKSQNSRFEPPCAERAGGTGGDRGGPESGARRPRPRTGDGRGWDGGWRTHRRKPVTAPNAAPRWRLLWTECTHARYKARSTAAGAATASRPSRGEHSREMHSTPRRIEKTQ